MTSTRVIALGLDAVDFGLVKDWATTGDLPNLRAVLDRSLSGIVPCPRGTSWITWPSLITGVLPGRHGRYYYNQIIPGTYRTEILRPCVLEREPLWMDLSRVGKRVAIVDMPKSDPTKGINGLQLADWGTHDPDFHGSPRSWPEGAAAELTARFGSDPVDINDFGGRGPSDMAGFRDRICANIGRRTRLFEALLAEGEWDLFFAVWDDAHQLGHIAWSIHDPGHPLHDPETAAAIGDPIKDVYMALDRAVGRILDRLRPEDTVMVYSSSGMGPSNHGFGLLDPILRRLDAAPSNRGSVHMALKSLWDNLPHGIQRGINHLKVRTRDRLLEQDWAGRTAFAVPLSDDGGGIRVNLKGRESQGKVEPGAAFDAYCDGLIAALGEVVDADTGGPLMTAVHRTRDLYPGPYVDRLPDLLIEWNTNTPHFAARSPRVGTVTQTYKRSRTGSHTTAGYLAAYGPGIEAGDLGPGVQVIDVLPTVAALLGVPLGDVDGRPIPAMTMEDA